MFDLLSIPLKALFATVGGLFPLKIIVSNEVQLRKALLSILVTVSGIAISFNDEQFAKKLLSILGKVNGKVTS